MKAMREPRPCVYCGAPAQSTALRLDDEHRNFIRVPVCDLHIRLIDNELADMRKDD